MALDTPPLLTKRKQLAFALETTNGTAATVGASQSVVPAFNMAMPYSTEAVDREKEGKLSPRRAGRGARSGTCTFETELFGNGSAGQGPLGSLFQMCGLGYSTGVYTPSDAPSETGTLAAYFHGRIKKLVGCMGSFTISFRRGQAPRIKWNFMGCQVAATDLTLIVPTKVTTNAPRVGATFTIGATTYRADNLDFESGNVVVLREDIDSDSGYRCAYITDREPHVKVAVESTLLATKDWYDFYHSSTTAALVVTVGAGSDNNTWSLGAPALELASAPQDGDRGGMLTDVLDFRCLGATDGAGAEYTLTET